jgi:hypothetical protein
LTLKSAVAFTIILLALVLAARPAGSTGLPAESAALSALPGDGKVSLSWRVAEGEPAWGFNVYRSVGGADAVPVRANLMPLPGGTSGRFEDASLENGRVYGYRVAAIDRNGIERPLPAVVFARPAFLPGDVDGQADAEAMCRVDGFDLVRVLASFGKGVGEPGFEAAADLNGDGRVDGLDLEITARHFGSRRCQADQTGGIR